MTDIKSDVSSFFSRVGNAVTDTVNEVVDEVKGKPKAPEPPIVVPLQQPDAPPPPPPPPPASSTPLPKPATGPAKTPTSDKAEQQKQVAALYGQAMSAALTPGVPNGPERTGQLTTAFTNYSADPTPENLATFQHVANWLKEDAGMANRRTAIFVPANKDAAAVREKLPIASPIRTELEQKRSEVVALDIAFQNAPSGKKKDALEALEKGSRELSGLTNTAEEREKKRVNDSSNANVDESVKQGRVDGDKAGDLKSSLESANQKLSELSAFIGTYPPEPQFSKALKLETKLRGEIEAAGRDGAKFGHNAETVGIVKKEVSDFLTT